MTLTKHKIAVPVRPVTAIVIVILLMLITGAALIQLWEILFPPG